MKTLVVGGRSGMGQEIADRLRNQRIVLTPSVRELDVTDDFMVHNYLAVHGPFTHIVYCAGVARLAWAIDLTMADFEEDFRVNAFGFALLLGAHKKLFADKDFSAVAIVSDAMRNPMRGSTTYCSSKAALAAIIRNLAREWSPGCRVNGVAPSIVADTPMTDYIDQTVPGFRGWEPDAAAKYEQTMLPMKRRATKEEVAEVVEFVLFGPGYMTGAIVDITGGK